MLTNSNTSTTSTRPTHATTPRPWWLELTLTDFRHAILPWLPYAIAVVAISRLTEPPTPFMFGMILSIMLLAPAVVTAVYSSDFGHATMPMLVTFPRSRARIWLARSVALALLLALPFVVGLIATAADDDPANLIARLSTFVTMGMFVFCYFGAGALLSALLRRPLLTWSATLIMPLLLLIVYLFLQNLFHIRWGRYAPYTFPWVEVAHLIFSLTVSLLFLVAGFYKWQRLELRS